MNTDELWSKARSTPSLRAIGRHVVEDAVIERYRAGRLSHRQVGEALGLNYWQAEAFLKERGVPLNYSVTDLEADAVTLEKILPRLTQPRHL